MVGLREILNEIIRMEGDQRAERPFHYGFHDAAHPCLRKLYRDATVGGGDPADLRSIFCAAVGSAVGEMVENAAVRLGFSKQVPVTLRSSAPVNAQGTADLVAPTGHEVVDIKVVGESTWHKVVKQGAGEYKHVQQVNGYAAAVDAPRWALYYLRGVSVFMPGELEWRVFPGRTNVVKAMEINERWSILKGQVDRREEPPKPAGYRRDSYPCGWCGHKRYCFGGEST